MAGSRPVSPFLEVAGNDEQLTTRVVYSEAPPDDPCGEADIDELHYEVSLDEIRITRQRIVTERSSISSKLGAILTATLQGVATAPPVTDDDDADDENHPSVSDRGIDDVILEAEQLSAMHFAAEESVSAMFRQIVPAAALTAAAAAQPSRDMVVNDDAIDLCLAQMNEADRQTLEACAAREFPDFNPEEDPAFSEMTCCVCTQVAIDPVYVLNEVYHRDCIEQWIRTNGTCPTTRAVITIEDMRANKRISNALALMLEKAQEEVVKKRQAHIRRLVTLQLLEEAAAAHRASDSIAKELPKLRNALERERLTRRQHEAANIEKIKRQREKFERQMDKQRVEYAKLQMQLDRQREETAARKSLLTQQQLSSIDELRARDAQLVDEAAVLDAKEKELFEKRLSIARSRAATKSSRLTAQRIVAPSGKKCRRCGFATVDQVVSKLYRCFRCDKTCCHSCCNNVGAVVGSEMSFSGGSDDDEERKGDEESDVVLLGPTVRLKVYAWKRICGSCYNVCLRARYHNEAVLGKAPPASTMLSSIREGCITTDDDLAFMYVLTPQERETFRYITNPSSIPRGLIAEWKLAPQSAALLVDSQLKVAQEEYLPALATASTTLMSRVQDVFRAWGLLSSPSHNTTIADRL